MTNGMRAAIIALAQSSFPVLVLLGVNLSSDAVAAIMLVITNAVTLLALIFPGPSGSARDVSEHPDLEALDIMPPSRSPKV